MFSSHQFFDWKSVLFQIFHDRFVKILINLFLSWQNPQKAVLWIWHYRVFITLSKSHDPILTRSTLALRKLNQKFWISFILGSCLTNSSCSNAVSCAAVCYSYWSILVKWICSRCSFTALLKNSWNGCLLVPDPRVFLEVDIRHRWWNFWFLFL